MIFVLRFLSYWQADFDPPSINWHASSSLIYQGDHFWSPHSFYGNCNAKFLKM